MSTALTKLTSPLKDLPKQLMLLLVSIGIVQMIFAILALKLGWHFAIVPGLLALSLVILARPHVGIAAFVGLIFLRVSLPGLRGIYPIDVIAFLVILSVAANRMIRGKAVVAPSPINRPFLLILAVFAISLVGAYDLMYGLKNWGRHLQLFAVTVSIISCTEKKDIKPLVNLLLFVTAVFSIVNVAHFVMVGGHARVFGITGPFFASFTVVASLQSAIGFLMSRRRGARVGWVALFFLYTAALVSTQTRAAMIQFILFILFSLVVIWSWSRSHQSVSIKRRVMFLSVLLLVFGVLFMTDSLPLEGMAFSRVSEVIKGHAQTVNYRLFLWKTGLRAFAGSPFLGIGLGQVTWWNQFLPFWRFDPISVHTRGLGAHNDFITYIAETGIFGMLALQWLFWRLLRTGLACFRRLHTIDQTKQFLMLWVPVCAGIGGFYFRTHMFYSIQGMLTAFLFALLIKQCENDLTGSPLKANESTPASGRNNHQ